MSWASAVYEVDRTSALICMQMTKDGFAFDGARAEIFSKALLDGASASRNAADEAVGFPIRRTKTGGFGMKEGGLTDAFFSQLRAPIYFRSELTNRPSLNANALQAYATSSNPRLAKLALSVIDYKRHRTLRSMFVEKILRTQLVNGRVHPGWQNYGTVSGRWSCQKPNLMNLPRRESDPTTTPEMMAAIATLLEAAGLDPSDAQGGIRSLYHAPAGRKLVKFDYSQLEFRVAAYASQDAAMIAACEASDVHAANARIVFGRVFVELTAATQDHGGAKGRSSCDCRLCDKWAALRTMAKTSAFAVCYLAEANTVHARILASWKQEWGPPPQLRETEGLLRRLRQGFAAYYEWTDRGFHDCIRTGYVETPVLGRRRQLGHDPKAPEAANFPIQGGAADIMNRVTPRILERFKAARISAIMVAQVHDSCVYECDAHAVDEVQEILLQECQAPVPELGGASFPIDKKVSQRWN